jgi:hypothetical protein
MTAVARPYKLGAASTKFEVMYGNITQDSTGNVTAFQRIMQQEVTLTSDQLTTWGLDDSAVLYVIATQIGTTVTGIVSGSNIPNMMF